MLIGRYARFFVIKSYSEDDVHKSIKYGVWASTDTGNRRLDATYREAAHKGPIYLFFSVNSSGQFCGVAQMASALDYTTRFGAWGQDKWNGTFQIQWTFIKDIPNNQVRAYAQEQRCQHRNTNGCARPVSCSRMLTHTHSDEQREQLALTHASRALRCENSFDTSCSRTTRTSR